MPFRVPRRPLGFPTGISGVITWAISPPLDATIYEASGLMIALSLYKCIQQVITFVFSKFFCRRIDFHQCSVFSQLQELDGDTLELLYLTDLGLDSHKVYHVGRYNFVRMFASLA